MGYTQFISLSFFSVVVTLVAIAAVLPYYARLTIADTAYRSVHIRGPVIEVVDQLLVQPTVFARLLELLATTKIHHVVYRRRVQLHRHQL